MCIVGKSSRAVVITAIKTNISLSQGQYGNGNRDRGVGCFKRWDPGGGCGDTCKCSLWGYPEIVLHRLKH